MDLGMRSAAQQKFGQWIASAREAVTRLMLPAPISLALILLAAASMTVTARAQAPQEWTATGYQNQTFPSEPSALAAIHSLGGKYTLAEVVQYVNVSSSGHRVTYYYQARPRPPETGDWYYRAVGDIDPSPVSLRRLPPLAPLHTIKTSTRCAVSSPLKWMKIGRC